MGNKKRIVGAAALGLLLFGGAFVAMNWTNIQRLKTVNTLFHADKIVHNFSHMNDAFLYQDLDASAAPFIWPENSKPLPETVTVAGKPRNLAKLLETLDTTALVVIQDGVFPEIE